MNGRAMTIGALVLGVSVSTAAAQPSVPPGLEVPGGQ